MPHEVNELFASHCMRALGIYVCATYCGLRTPKSLTGGLSAWQARVATEMIEAHLDGGIALEQLAQACGLSVSRFAHAFKTTIGMAPYQWLLQRRIERTKALLKQSAGSLVDIAQSCGVADQSHFTRVFKRAVGESPGAWRQSLH